MKLIDKYMQTWDYAKKNIILILMKDLPEASIIYNIDFNKSKIIRALFCMRGLKLTINDFINIGFIALEDGKFEIVIGLIAKPWKIKGNLLLVSSKEFIPFKNTDYIKVVWNFSFEKTEEESVDIVTETRIQCTSDSAKMKFSLYWFFVGYFSGVIRNEMLKIIKKEVLNNSLS